MRTKKVEEIILPYTENVPIEPSVTIGDKIIDAIELMVSNNIRNIAIVKNKRPIGIIRLEDAFQKLGLHVP
ncbi:MAG: CBS domain-containing protein [Deltaproteobacteria bacterium]|nr:CBS domain-containing protein [Deltaproteobacteria bacterium]MBW2139821.1 CBS domain-containing protein [Deltaproteobacteria bacterium]MBW2322171.1 CBS domain-containing protein [Deltaproteobacteria bacterium]